MRIRSLIQVVSLAALISISFTNCSIQNQVESELKKLDSLNIVLTTKLSELNKCDTLLLTRAILKFTDYVIFIENNLSDTITKTEANGLQQFYMSGNNLKAFAVNRFSLNTRSSLVNSQIKNLLLDLKKDGMSKDEFLKNYDTETKVSIQLISLTEQEIKNYNNSIQDFKNSISLVEELIKSKNNGQLPAAIKDSVNI